jgi:hypothetical protein
MRIIQIYSSENWQKLMKVHFLLDAAYLPKSTELSKVSSFHLLDYLLKVYVIITTNTEH